MTRSRRAISRSSLELAVRELSRRPAMNGGFKRVAAQQEEQLKHLRDLEARTNRVENWQARFDRRLAWGLGLLGSIAVPVVGRAVYDLLTKLAHMVH